VGAHRFNGRTHGRSRSHSIIHENHDAPVCVDRRAVAPQCLFAERELTLRHGLRCGKIRGRDAMPPDHGVVEYTGPSAGNGADGILRMPWHANFSHNEYVEWGSQYAGHLGGHRNATAREAEHDDPRPRRIARQHRGKVGTGLVPVSEQDGHGWLRSGDSAQRTDGMAACLSDKSRRLATTDSCGSSRAWLTVDFPTTCQTHPDSTQRSSTYP
jgi:hypothetical protein